jgi:hypothetical protein
MTNVDIIQIDASIRDQLSDVKLDELRTMEKEFVASIERSSDTRLVRKFGEELAKLRQRMADAETMNTLMFYISDTVEYIEEYKSILKVPKRMNFMGKVIEPDNIRKIEVINSYLEASSKYSHLIQDRIAVKTKCVNCGRHLEYEILDDCSYICNFCSSDQGSSVIVASYSDADRVNVSSKYSYDRKTHFRECLGQYHGKQNVSIPEKIYTSLDECFVFHSLLNGDENTPRVERYSRVTKGVILRFLKEIGIPKQYENINLIYSVITGTDLHDISGIIDPILEDFDILSDLYDKKYTNGNRKNFINTQYVLFQLLRKHGHECDKEDFSNLKTVDRKFFHEDILKRLFQDLGWNYVSIF